MRIALWSWSIQSPTCHEPIRSTLSNVFSLLARRPTPKMPPVTEMVTTALGTSGAPVRRITACAPFRRPTRSCHAEQAEQEQQGSKRKAPAIPYLYSALAVKLTGFLGYSQFALRVAYTSFHSWMHCLSSYLASIFKNTRPVAYLFGFGSGIVSIFCVQGLQGNGICTFSAIRKCAGRIEPILDRGPNPRSAAHRRAGRLATSGIADDLGNDHLSKYCWPDFPGHQRPRGKAANRKCGLSTLPP